MKTIKMIRHTDSLMEIVGEDHGYHPMDVKLYVLASEAEAEIARLKDENGNMDSMYQDKLLDMEAKVYFAAERERVLVEALEEFVDTNWYFYCSQAYISYDFKEYEQMKSKARAALAQVEGG